MSQTFIKNDTMETSISPVNTPWIKIPSPDVMTLSKFYIAWSLLGIQINIGISYQLIIKLLSIKSSKLNVIRVLNNFVKEKELLFSALFLKKLIVISLMTHQIMEKSGLCCNPYFYRRNSYLIASFHGDSCWIRELKGHWIHLKNKHQTFQMKIWNKKKSKTLMKVMALIIIISLIIWKITIINYSKMHKYRKRKDNF